MSKKMKKPKARVSSSFRGGQGGFILHDYGMQRAMMGHPWGSLHDNHPFRERFDDIDVSMLLENPDTPYEINTNGHELTISVAADSIEYAEEHLDEFLQKKNESISLYFVSGVVLDVME